MAPTANTATKPRRWLAPLLSVIGSVIVVTGFYFPSIFVSIAEPCRARFCHFGVIHRSILSGWQILAINAHPVAPPFIRLIAAPRGLIGLAPLVVGGIALFISVGDLVREPPRWVLLLSLGLAAIGLLSLAYDTVLLMSGVGVYSGGDVVTTSMTPMAIAGHAMLYGGYLLLVLGIAQMHRRNQDTILLKSSRCAC